MPEETRVQKNRKIRIALLINEFFGGGGTAFGGYGYLARHYIAKYIPNEQIEMDVLLGPGEKPNKAVCIREDNIDLYYLPSNELHASAWLRRKDYDLYLSIELTDNHVLKLEPDQTKRLILWIQDPRPWYDWREINTVKLFPEKCYWGTDIYELVHRMHEEGRVRFVTQGHFLKDKAIDLYRLENEVPIEYLANPIDIDDQYSAASWPKKNHICFLGRIESVKRGWLFCEIAKAMPEYEFFMLGQTFREKEENASILSQYSDIPNLHFVGHVEGEQKNAYLRDAKIMVNTSIHEALPISFLEAMSYGILLVSCQNPENLVARFGTYVGQVLGDGFDKVPLFVEAIRTLMKDDPYRHQIANEAADYVQRIHNVPLFINSLRNHIFEEYDLRLKELAARRSPLMNKCQQEDLKRNACRHTRLKQDYYLSKILSHILPSKKLRAEYKSHNRIIKKELRLIRQEKQFYFNSINDGF